MIRALALLALAAAAIARNAIMLVAPGCKPTWLTVSVALCCFAPLFFGGQHLLAHVTGAPVHAPRSQWAAAAFGVVAIVLSFTFSADWAAACAS
jgi:hypothetical protein